MSEFVRELGLRLVCGLGAVVLMSGLVVGVASICERLVRYVRR